MWIWCLLIIPKLFSYQSVHSVINNLRASILCQHYARYWIEYGCMGLPHPDRECATESPVVLSIQIIKCGFYDINWQNSEKWTKILQASWFFDRYEADWIFCMHSKESLWKKTCATNPWDIPQQDHLALSLCNMLSSHVGPLTVGYTIPFHAGYSVGVQGTRFQEFSSVYCLLLSVLYIFVQILLMTRIYLIPTRCQIFY